MKLVALTFFALAAYVTIEGIRSLVAGEVPEGSTVGMVLLALSIIVMPLLARAKRRVGDQLGGDPLILADAAETRICVLLSVSTCSVSSSSLSPEPRGRTRWPGSSSPSSPSRKAERPGKANWSRTTMTTTDKPRRGAA